MIFHELLLIDTCLLSFQPAAAAGAAVPLDTPSVVAARAHHFQAKAAQYALVGPGPYYDHGGYYGGIHH